MRFRSVAVASTALSHSWMVPDSGWVTMFHSGATLHHKEQTVTSYTVEPPENGHINLV